MSKGNELVKLAKEDNASRFGDVLSSALHDRVIQSIEEKRKTLFGKSGE